MSIDNLFDVDCDNVHMVQVDSFEATTPQAPIMPTNLAPTPKQFAFMKQLFSERSQNEEAQILRTHLLSELKAGKLTRNMASEAIGDVLSIPKDKTDRPVTTSEAAHGQVWVTTGGAYVRIKESNSSGRLYGLVWNERTEEWDYEIGRETNVMRHLNHLCTAEEAKKWAQQWEGEFQQCVFCSRPLSDERSEFAGYGETCARNNGLPWGATANG